ncbi:MAG TPA: choice-of-anchor tandem repeat GloVer-containing protein, partial [Tepidisphaeraceae bacterium]
MSSRRSPQSRWFSALTAGRLRAAIAGAIPVRSRPVHQAAKAGSRPHWETIEPRVLFSTYGVSQVGVLSINDTGVRPRSTLVADSSGNLYGTTSIGGAYGYGTVFEVAQGSNAITTLISFNNIDGANPYAGVTLDPAGNLYGTTYNGGTYGDGTVFEIASGSTAITTLASFNGANGASPRAGITIDASGNLYGTTYLGGTANDGTVFGIRGGSTAITTVASFNGTNGLGPYAGLTLDASGNLYGTTSSGGANNQGAVFEIASGSTALTTIASFGLNNLAVLPAGYLAIDGSGNLFGTSVLGGSYGTYGGVTSLYGTVFEVAAGSSAITVLVSFNNADGQQPNGGVTLDPAGNLYGTTGGGGNAFEGTVFEVASGTAAITTLATFNGANGDGPLAGVTIDPLGNLYGTTQGGGANNQGTVFEVARGSTTATAVASFDLATGMTPRGGLARDASGNLYGATESGGESQDGTVFMIAQGSGAVTTLAAFTGTDGAYPYGGVTLDASGNLYGTTYAGGASGYGTVFEIAAGSSAITTIASFNQTDGSNPESGITLDSAGNLYGTTNFGGADYSGTVFEIAKGSTTITTLVSFKKTNGANPESWLTLDAVGDLYGTTEAGGPQVNGQGTVFEIAEGSSTITTLASFSGANGGFPIGGLTPDASGNLYGTTFTGGASKDGTVFEIAAGSTTITTIASFNGANGYQPMAGVSVDASGNLYGTTEWGGPGNAGTAFEIAHGSSTITTLATFTDAAGAPLGALLLDSRGNLIGTASVSGGMVFELIPNTTATLAPTIAPNPSDAGQPLTFTGIVRGGVPDGETVTLLDTSNNNAVVATGMLAGGSTTLTVPAGTLSVGTHNLIAVYGGDANFAASESAAYAQVVTPAPLPAWLTTGSQATWDASTHTLTVTGAAVINADPGADEPNIVESGAAAQLVIQPATSPTDIHVGGISLSNGAKLQMASVGAGRTHANHNVLVVGIPGAANDPAFSIDGTSTLDLSDNDLILHVGSSDASGTAAYASVFAAAKSGRHGDPATPDGTWYGNGLDSSAANAVYNAQGYEQVALGVVDNNQLVFGALSKWTVGTASENLGANDVLVKYTYVGD